MAKKKSVWEVYLRPNTLTKDNDRDCIAVVHSSSATRRNEDIADIITKERTESRKETIINILNMRDNAVKDLIQEGVSFMDSLVQISPRVSGVWETENSPYDEKIHKRTVDLIPTADLRTALDAIGAKEETARRLSVNKPGQIIACIPEEVPEGKVTVIVHTKFSTGNKTLSNIREIVYKLPCTAKT